MQPLLQAFHCLSVQAKIDYNLSTICHNFFSDLSPAYFPDHLTVYTSSRQLRSSAETWILCIPHVTQKPLANAVSPTMLQSNAVHSFLTSIASNPHPSHPIRSCLQNCIKNSLQTIPQVIPNSILLLASCVYPPSPLIAFLLCTHVCVYLCVCEEYNIMTV